MPCQHCCGKGPCPDPTCIIEWNRRRGIDLQRVTIISTDGTVSEEIREVSPSATSDPSTSGQSIRKPRRKLKIGKSVCQPIDEEGLQAWRSGPPAFPAEEMEVDLEVPQEEEDLIQLTRHVSSSGIGGMVGTPIYIINHLLDNTLIIGAHG